MMLGFLLARAGVDVVVLEKHADFLRDFRGDTVHPSTLEAIAELGLIDAFLQRPHQDMTQLGGVVNGQRVVVAEFAQLRARYPFIALMPQWDFLNFIAEHAARYPGFRLLMQAEVTDLLITGGTIAGVRVRTPEGPREIRADLVVGADGRHSTVRTAAGLRIKDLGAPIDVLWMRLSKRPGDPGMTLGYFNSGRGLVTLDRGGYWQCGLVIRKGGFDGLRTRGLEALYAEIVALAPFLGDRMHELQTWDDVKLLTVRIDRLRRWYRPRLLCIGDAAHAMSPMGGVGINLAVQDAIAAANVLAGPLRDRAVTPQHLAQIEHRRTWPTVATQTLQVLLGRVVFGRAPRPLAVAGPPQRTQALPLALRIVRRFPALRRIPARIVGIGFRPEHIRTPEIAEAAP